MKGLIKISKRYLGVHNGLHVVEFDPQDFKLVYFDKTKLSAKEYGTAFNAGFFANIKEGSQKFTLPVANLAASTEYGIHTLGEKYIEEWTNKQITNNKVKINCNQNGAPDFKNKLISTLVVTNSNKVYIDDINSLPNDVKFAVSGCPCIKDGDDVNWKTYVSKQGWSSTVYGTSRNWLATKGNKMYLLSGKTTSKNYIFGCEFWYRVRDLKLDSCVGLDGGGSYVFFWEKKLIARTFENRRINSIGIINN